MNVIKIKDKEYLREINEDPKFFIRLFTSK